MLHTCMLMHCTSYAWVVDQSNKDVACSNKYCRDNTVVHFNLKEHHQGGYGAKAATLAGNDHQISGHASGTSFQRGQA